MKLFKKKELKTKQLMLLDDALKKLVEFGIATIVDNKYQYSKSFEQTASDIINSPPSKLKQIKLGQEAGRKLLPDLLTLATHKPSRRDIENLMIAYVCLKTHVEKQNLNVDKKLISDLAYAIWYLNDNNPTIKEVEEWNPTLQTKIN